MDIKGSIALVTGANRGIGRAFVEALAAQGAAKIYAAARDVSTLTELPDGDAEIVPIALDVDKPVQINAVAATHRDVTLLINNAGIARYAGAIAADSLDDARAEMETNYFGTLGMIRAFAPVLAANGDGAIVNVASIGSFVNVPVLGSYSASKAAVHSITQAVRAELAGQNIQIVGVYPGLIDTDMAAGFAMDKAPPRQVAEATFRAVVDGQEDVYPDDTATSVRDRLLGDPKTVEREFGAMLPGM